jgi:Thiolase C-terminal domain-like
LAWRERPLRRRAHPQRRRTGEPCRPVRAALRADGAADFIHDPGLALHEDIPPDPRDLGDGLGRAARMDGQELARHLQDADHRRGRAELADDRLPVPAIAVLPGDRWRRCLDPGCGRARPRLPAKAGLPPRHRRVCRHTDGQPNGRFHLLARLPRRRRQGLCRGRHHPQRRRPSDDLRRPLFAARASFAHLPLYGLQDLGFVPRGEAGALIAERNTAPGGKLPLNTNGGGLSYMHSGMYGMYALQERRAPDARHRPRPDPRRQDLGMPWCRRHVRRLRHYLYVERAAVSRDGADSRSRQRTSHLDPT